MKNGKKIAIVMPAYNEERLIENAISMLPDYIDRIIVINDASKDKTKEIVESLSYLNNKILLINHEINKGVGGAIATGYKECIEESIDIAVVMAGDSQMDPRDLPELIKPIIHDEADFAKGNRLFWENSWRTIPKIRFIGNSCLSLLTKLVSGYWDIADSQCGYTAINNKALNLINWDKMYKRYGQPNDLLVRLNIFNLKVVDVPVRPVYNIGEKSGIKPLLIIPKFIFLLTKLFFYRINEKYLIRNTHPVFLFYFFGIILSILNIPLIVRLISRWIEYGSVPEITVLSVIFVTISSIQFILFAFLFDIFNSKIS